MPILGHYETLEDTIREQHYKTFLKTILKMNSQLSRGMHTKKLRQIREKNHMEGQN